jgi:hypothetical protein
MTRRFLGFTEVILRCHRHLNPNHINSIDLIHVQLHVSHVHYDTAKDPPDDGMCIDDLGTRFPPTATLNVITD